MPHINPAGTQRLKKLLRWNGFVRGENKIGLGITKHKAKSCKLFFRALSRRDDLGKILPEIRLICQ